MLSLSRTSKTRKLSVTAVDPDGKTTIIAFYQNNNVCWADITKGSSPTFRVTGIDETFAEFKCKIMGKHV